MNKLSGYIAPVQAARRLGVSRQMIWILIKIGRLDALETPLGNLVEEASVARLQGEGYRPTAGRRRVAEA